MHRRSIRLWSRMLSPPIRVNRRVLLCLAHPFSPHPVRLPQRRSTLLLRAPPAPSPHCSPYPPLLFHTIRRGLGNLLRNRFARCRQRVLDRRAVCNGSPCAVTATIAAVSISTASSALIGQFCATILQARDLGFRFMGLIQSSLDAFLRPRRSTASRRRFIGRFPPFTFRQLLQVIRVALLHVAPHDGLHPHIGVQRRRVDSNRSPSAVRLCAACRSTQWNVVGARPPPAAGVSATWARGLVSLSSSPIC